MRQPSRFLVALVLLATASASFGAQTLIHYRLNDTDAITLAGGFVPNAGTLGSGIVVNGTTLSAVLPTNGVPPDAGNRSVLCIGANGILAPGTQQLHKTNIFNAGGFTYEAWFKWTGAGTINSIIDYAGTEKLIRDASHPGVAMEWNNSLFHQIGGAAPDEWHYAAVVFTSVGPVAGDGSITGHFAFYLDTNAPAAYESNAVISAFGDSLIRTIGVGMHPAAFSGDYFNGLIYEPRVTLGAVPAHGLLFKPRLVVTTNANAGPGSLRDAVAAAPNGAVITFAPALSGQTITLTNGEIIVATNLTIDASELANGITISGNNNSRIFHVDAGTTVTLNSLSIRGGYDANGGGGIDNGGNLTLNACNVSDNTATNSSFGAYGGGIFSYQGTLTLNGCTLSGNHCSSSGGGIYMQQGTLTLNNCTLSGNSAYSSGGIMADQANVTLNGCTLSGNSAEYEGGGILNFKGNLTVNDCTLSGNSAGVGGGIYTFRGHTAINRCTISANAATPFAGGGVASDGDFSLTTIEVRHSIIAGNLNGDVARVIGFANNFTSLGHNLVGSGNTLAAFNQPGDVANANPLLAPLGNYGGPTQTMPPLPGSPAIDAATNSTATTDQRGFARPVDGDNNGSAVADIGAVEVTQRFVTNISDSGDGSLRKTVADAPAYATVGFIPALSGQTIALTSGQITITNFITISSSGLNNGITISGNTNSRIFQVNAGRTVTLHSLTIRDGFAPDVSYPDGGGGGIWNSGNLTLHACTLQNNRATQPTYDPGGGILNYQGTLTLNACTLSGNHCDDQGGGIFSSKGNLTLHNCTFSGNSAGNGGGLYSDTDLSAQKTTVVNSTFSGNTATISGGGIHNNDGMTKIIHCTITGNTAGEGGGVSSFGDNFTPTTVTDSIIAGNTNSDVDLFLGSVNSFTSSGFNLVGTGSALAKFNQTGDLTNAVPLLAALGNYGGPTRTMPPLFGSPAIDAGANSTTITDQRGFARVSGDAVDIGAVEVGQIMVTSTDDSGADTLRQAVLDSTPLGIVTIAPWLYGDTIGLTSGEITITQSVSIDASALITGIIISGNNISRVFRLMTNTVVTLDSLTITEGRSSFNGLGGGILVNSNARLTVNNSCVVSNSAGFGGGILSDGGTLIVRNSTFFGNSATHGTGGLGGGIYNFNGRLAVTNCTIVGNSAGTSGGGIDASGNSSLANTIVAGNTAPDLPNVFGSFSGANNLTNVNPLLAPLGNYDGHSPTMPPLPGSPAIEGGNLATALPTDQRGAPRPNGPLPDIGAVEAFPFSTIQRVDDDGDGMDDRLEIGYFGSTNAVNAASDSDGDGSKDRDELASMTNPQSAASVFKIASFQFLGTYTAGRPNYNITISTFPGLSYSLLRDQSVLFTAQQTNNLGVANGYSISTIMDLQPGRDFVRARRN